MFDHSLIQITDERTRPRHPFYASSLQNPEMSQNHQNVSKFIKTVPKRDPFPCLILLIFDDLTVLERDVAQSGKITP